MIAKLLPAAMGLTVLLLMASSFSVPMSESPRVQQTCSRPLMGSGWICVWEPDPGERCWQTNLGSACAKEATVRAEPSGLNDSANPG